MSCMLFYEPKIFETFKIEGSNCEALWTARQFASEPCSYEAVYIYGEKGNGKKHLLNAIENEFALKGIHYVAINWNLISTEMSFQSIYPELYSQKTFLDEYENEDVLLVEDIHDFREEEMQEIVNLLINTFLEKKKPVFITGEYCSDELKENPRIKTVEIKSPERDLKKRIYREYVEKWGYKFDDAFYEEMADNAKSIKDLLDKWRYALNYCAASKEQMSKELIRRSKKYRMYSMDEMIEKLDKACEENE